MMLVVIRVANKVANKVEKRKRIEYNYKQRRTADTKKAENAKK